MEKSNKQRYLIVIKKCINLYIKTNARSKDKTKFLHNFLQSEIQKCFSNQYKVLLEHNILSCNITKRKKCDIVVLDKEENPFIVFPVKFPMSNYNQNKNNSWENLTGECLHLKIANKNLKIIPINIIINQTPYKKRNGIIKKFENIEYEKSLKITETLVEKKICYDIVNYIINVEHQSKIGENYSKWPKMIDFNEATPYREFKNILKNLI